MGYNLAEDQGGTLLLHVRVRLDGRTRRLGRGIRGGGGAIHVPDEAPERNGEENRPRRDLSNTPINRGQDSATEERSS